MLPDHAVVSCTPGQGDARCSSRREARHVVTGQCVALLPRSVLNLLGTPSELKTLRVGRVDTCLLWRNGYDVPAFRHLLQQLKEA